GCRRRRGCGRPARRSAGGPAATTSSTGCAWRTTVGSREDPREGEADACPSIEPVAVGLEGAVHGAGGNGRGVQPEAVAVGLGGEAVLEQPLEVLGADPAAVVLDLEADVLVVGGQADLERAPAL